MSASSDVAVSLPSRRLVLLSIALLVAACAGVYSQTAGFEYLHWDDTVHLLDNPALRGGLSPATFRWAFSLSEGSFLRPIPWITHALDFSLFGLDPAGPHLVNLGLHAANAVLLFLLLLRATGSLGPSLLSGALWALHPLRAEAVAWVSGRKDLLALGLTLAVVAAHAGWAERPTRRRRLAVIALFVLAILAKPVVVVLPVALLAVDVWPLGRTASVPLRRLVLEKVPLLVIAALAAVPTYLTQLWVGAVRPMSEVGIALRLTNAGAGFVWYVENFFLPRNLAFYYPLVFQPSARLIVAGTLLFLGGTAAAALLAKRSPAFLAGWIWFVVVLAPTIGLVQTGGQGAADRYSYIPAAGLTAGVVFTIDGLLRGRRAPKGARAVAAAAGAALAAAFAVSAHAQAATWKNDLALFGNAAEVTKGNWLAHYNLAATLESYGDARGALPQAIATLDIAPAWEPALSLLDRQLERLGRGAELLPYALRAVRANPGSSYVHVLAGEGARRRGDLRAARAFYERALVLEPVDPGAREGLAALDRAGAPGTASHAPKGPGALESDPALSAPRPGAGIP